MRGWNRAGISARSSSRSGRDLGAVQLVILGLGLVSLGLSVWAIRADVALSIHGEDGFSLNDVSSMRMIRRSPVELVRQLMGEHHQYPDGAALYTGTMFAPTQDRGEAGRGFTHHVGDVVTVSTPGLGALVNRVRHCDSCAPWVFGQAALMRNLASRGLI